MLYMDTRDSLTLHRDTRASLMLDLNAAKSLMLNRDIGDSLTLNRNTGYGLMLHRNIGDSLLLDRAIHWGPARHLVSCGADALVYDHVVHRLIVHTQDLCGAKLLIVGGLAVCQAGSILHAGRRACSKPQGLPIFLKNTAAKSTVVVGLAVCQAGSTLYAGQCA